jgi:tetratricopeptide (TPR) repeat protein
MSPFFPTHALGMLQRATAGLACAWLAMGVSVAWSADPAIDAKALVGKRVGGESGFTLDTEDTKYLEPACTLVFTYQIRKGGEAWFTIIETNPIPDRPEYAMARGPISLHHYCYAKVSLSRYHREKSAKLRAKHLLRTVNEFNFMVQHPEWLPKNWPYLATMYVELGRAYLIDNQFGPAVGAFTKALDIDKSYRDAYVALSGLMAEKGARDKALAYATEGLRHHPESKNLQRRYTELGGKLPYPEPYKKETSPPTQVPQAAESISTAAATEATSGTATPTSEPLPSPTPDATSTEPEKKPNPHCRFCP